jgi:predicted permease
MAILRRIALRLYHLFRPGAGEAELEREVASHLSLLEDDFVARGLTPDEARRQARVALGGVAQVKDGHRDARAVRWLDDVRRDLFYGLRALRRVPGFTLVAVLTLGLGLGANTAIFTAINSQYLSHVAVPHAENLVRLRWSGANEAAAHDGSYGYSAKDAVGEPVRPGFSYAAYLALRSNNRTLTDLAAFAPIGDANVVVDGKADIASAEVVSGNYCALFNVPVLRGRPLEPEDDRSESAPVALISYRYWSSRFGLDETTVGKVVTVDNVPVMVIGVVSPDFSTVEGLGERPRDVTLPLAWTLHVGSANHLPQLNDPGTWSLEVMGRLRDGATLSQAKGNLEGALQQVVFEAQQPTASGPNPTSSKVPRLEVDSGERGIYDTRPDSLAIAAIVAAVAAIVLLIACANVANLFLSRALSRQHEIWVRRSLGASRSRVIRQLLTESMLVSSIGGVVGFIGGYWLLHLLAQGEPVGIDWRVVGFAAGLTIVTGVACGIVPAFRGTRVPGSARSIKRGRTRLSAVLLVLQVSLSLPLMVCAGLLVRTVTNLQNVDVGFTAEHLALFGLNPALSGYDSERTGTLYGDVRQLVQTIPGVRSVSFSNSALLAGFSNTTSIFIPDHPGAGRRGSSVSEMIVSPEFFTTTGIPVLSGRAFEERDTIGTAASVAILNETAAGRYFPSENPVGRRFGYAPAKTGDVEVVGVVRDTKYDTLRKPSPPILYTPFPRNTSRAATFEVLTSGDPAAALQDIRVAVRRADPNVPLVHPTTQTAEIDQRMGQESMLAIWYSSLGLLALLLASVGLFGVMSTSVARRTGEIGIRMALGARRGQVVRSVLRESMVMVGWGVALGLVLALTGGRLISSLLFGLAPSDPTTVVAAVGIMLGVSLLAGYVPARRAARVDPLMALRQD